MPAARLVALAALTAAALAPRAPERDRGPVDLRLLPDGRTLTANRDAGSVSLVDPAAGKVLAEAPVGAQPFALAVAADGRRAGVTCTGDDTLRLFSISPDGLAPSAPIPVGGEPRGVVFSRDGRLAYVALGADGAVAVVDLEKRLVTRRFTVGLEPWHLALSADGKTLVVANTRSRDASVLDTATGAARYTVRLSGRNPRQIALSPDGNWAYLPYFAERQAPAIPLNIDRGWVVGNRLARVPLTGDEPREAITLDSPGAGVADIEGLALSPDGRTAALAASGTHELVLLTDVAEQPFVAYGGPGDHAEPATRRALRRIPLGGQPRACRFTADGSRVIVADAQNSRVLTVDVATAKVIGSVALGSAPDSAERRGAALFHDAKRSFGGWYSCATCHVEGHSGGGSFDTANDGGYGKPKKTPSLRGVVETGPWTWHGWQKDLRQAVRDSFTRSMQGPAATEAETDDVMAYLKTLTWRRSPFAPNAASQRGQAVFLAKGCDSCHGGPTFSSPKIVSAGLEEFDDVYKGYNPPSLRNVYSRAPYLHDGRAPSLEKVFTVHHRPSQLTGKPDCTPAELSDLIAYLKTL